MIVLEHIKKCLRFVISLKLRSYLQLIFGFYTEWSKRKDLIVAEIIYCVLYHVATLLAFGVKLISNSQFFSRVYVSSLALEYFTCMIITFFTKGLYCRRFYSDLKIIDKTMGVKISSTTSISSACLVLLCIPYGMIAYTLLSYNYWYWFGELFTTTMMLLFVFLHQTHKIVLFEMFWKRMRAIRRQLTSEMNGSDKNGKIKSITKWLLVYKNLLVSVERIIGAVKLSIIFTVFFATLQNFLHIINLINVLKEGWLHHAIHQDAVYLISVATLLRLMMTICVFLPALLAEMVLHEYDEIKGLLATNLLYCSPKGAVSDKELRTKIHKSLDYLDSRVPRYNVWRLFQLDISLPITFFNLNLAFLILVLQYYKE